MESEAEVNEFAMDKMIEDMPMDAEGSGRSAGGDHRNEPSPGGQEGIAAGRYGWMQRRDVPRRRSISTAWRKNDESWNVNPWAIIASSGADNESPADPGSLTFTSDSTIINKNTAQIIKPASSGSPGQGSGQPAAPLPPPTSHPDNDTQDAAMVAAVDTVEQGGAQSDNSEGAHSAARTTNLTPSRSTIPPGSSGSGEKSTLPQENVEVAEAEPLVSSAPSPSSMEGSLTATAEMRKVNVAEEKAWFLKRIKADPAHYDEDAILQHLTELRGNQGLGKAQLKIIITAAASAAKAMRRKHLVDRLGEAAKAAS
ncbi:hypothetical protein GQ54DRAFT_261106 [Martensiomyces pterosporus]|nr:hypothetical protein GQ54DRAFT_261106 [Martensiomyces pterosporus]